MTDLNKSELKSVLVEMFKEDQDFRKLVVSSLQDELSSAITVDIKTTTAEMKQMSSDGSWRGYSDGVASIDRVDVGFEQFDLCQWLTENGYFSYFKSQIFPVFDALDTALDDAIILDFFKEVIAGMRYHDIVDLDQFSSEISSFVNSFMKTPDHLKDSIAAASFSRHPDVDSELKDSYSLNLFFSKKTSKYTFSWKKVSA